MVIRFGITTRYQKLINRNSLGATLVEVLTSQSYIILQIKSSLHSVLHLKKERTGSLANGVVTYTALPRYYQNIKVPNCHRNGLSGITLFSTSWLPPISVHINGDLFIPPKLPAKEKVCIDSADYFL